MGIWEPAKVATKRLRNASNYVRGKGVGSFYAFGGFLPQDIALGHLFYWCTSRCFSGVSRHVFTLDRLWLPEKRILKSMFVFTSWQYIVNLAVKKRRSFWAGFAKWVRSVIIFVYVKLRSARIRSTWVCCHWIKTPDFMAPPNLVNFPPRCGKRLFQNRRSHRVHHVPCTMHFECLESVPNDSTRVRRLTGILRRARVKIFILAYGSFWAHFPGFSSNLTGHHETKTAKRIWSCRSKYWNLYIKPRLHMTNEGVLNRFRSFRAVNLQPIWPYRYERRLISQNEHL
jgi:hypothetical protein